MRLKWDHYSDQPEVIKDKALRKSISKSNRWYLFKMLLTNVFAYPIVYGFYLLSPEKKKPINTDNFFGISINLDKNPKETQQFINDLNINNILIRVPLHDIENLSEYIQFAETHKDKNILINVLQDRRHVEDLVLLKQSLEKIFKKFSHLTNRFQIANAINRKKWAIFHMDEYFAFFKVAHDLKKDKFPQLILLGSPIIDFEYYFTIRTLFNFHKISYDECSSLLYVDRRGAPENKQLGLDLVKKLYLLQAMLRLSPKTGDDIVITETNWPITQTHPYAPTCEKDCVTLEEHADFLVRYYLLALSSGVVKNVYWHQLIAPGYGLIDNRGDVLTKYPAYQAFKTLLFFLQGADFIKIKQNNGLYRILFKGKNNRHIEVLWSLSSTKVATETRQAVSRDGEKISKTKDIDVGGSPIYLIDAKHEI